MKDHLDRYGVFWIVITGMVLYIVFAFRAQAAEMQSCTWDVCFTVKGQEICGKSDRPTLVSDEKIRDLFHPLASGAVLVKPGSWYECDGRRVNILVVK